VFSEIFLFFQSHEVFIGLALRDHFEVLGMAGGVAAVGRDGGIIASPCWIGQVTRVKV
jgi:hypothetical protein